MNPEGEIQGVQEEAEPPGERLGLGRRDFWGVHKQLDPHRKRPGRDQGASQCPGRAFGWVRGRFGMSRKRLGPPGRGWERPGGRFAVCRKQPGPGQG